MKTLLLLPRFVVLALLLAGGLPSSRAQFDCGSLVGGDFDDYGCCTPCGCTGCSAAGGCSCGQGGFKSRLDAACAGMAENGIVYDFIGTQFYQGAAAGGVEQSFEYGGKIDQFMILDSTKMGLWEGMTMIMHVESRLGQDVNFSAVPLSPVNAAMLYPKSTEHDTAITSLQFAQALNASTLFTFGKFNSFDQFYSLYPQTGRGITGFMNTAMVIPISTARVAPLSYLGTGVVKMKGAQAEGGISVYDTNGNTTTSGFDKLFDNGCNISLFWRFFTDLGGLPGSHYFGAIASTGEFTPLDPTGFVFVPGQGIVAQKETGAYTLLYILEQTLWTSDSNPAHSVTLLSQNGLADERTSPFGWSSNIAIQGTGINRRRPQDSIGIGAFYTGISDDLINLVSPIAQLDDVYGTELYYNFSINKMLNLTTDLQIIEPGNAANDTAVVAGIRASVAL